MLRLRSTYPLIALVLALLSACASARPTPVVFAPGPELYPAVAASEMRVYSLVYESDLPGGAVRIGSARRRGKAWSDAANTLAVLRARGAQRGANAIVYAREGSDEELVAVRLLTPATWARADSLALARTAAVGRTAASDPGGGGGDVQVRGYCRRDGVCVRPHTRSRPSSGGGRRRP